MCLRMSQYVTPIELYRLSLIVCVCPPNPMKTSHLYRCHLTGVLCTFQHD